MTNTWTFGGSTLSTFGRVTVVNDYLDVPERRGENQLVPYRNGKIYVPKYYDERTITLGIAVVGTSATNLESQIDDLKKLISPRTEQTLSDTREDTSIRTAQASVNKSMQVERKSDKIAMAIIEFQLSNPLFRLSTAITDNTTTIDANPTAMTVTNPGTVEERDAVFTLTGPLSNTVITNSTTGQTLTYTGTIASPRVVTIKTNTTGEYIATDDLAANMISHITHSGSVALMTFNPGANTLSIADDTATTGQIGISFYAPFL